MFRREEKKDELLIRKSGEDRPLKNLLVTGGCGFIASNFINVFSPSHPDVMIYNVDKLDYCGNLNSIEQEIREDSKRYKFIRGDIGNTDLIMHILTTYDIDTLVNFAAQTHVDNSFGNSMSFTQTNVLGTHNLLECARVYGKLEKFIHVSTDEVYGEVESTQTEHGVLNPTNPYAATKAAAEFIVKSYTLSFGLPCIITRGNNVYGPYQYPEKLIPRFLMLMNQGRKLTVQGTGQNSRTFIHAHDVASAFVKIIDKGIIGEVYNIGCREEHSVMDIACLVVRYFHGENACVNDFIEFIADRDFNDQRYDIDTSKLKALGWAEQMTFDEGFRQTADWYVKDALPNKFWPSIKSTISTSRVNYPMVASSPNSPTASSC